MIHDEWSELCEVSKSIMQIQSQQDHALHLFMEGNPIASIVVHAVENETLDENEQTILIHPVMFDFLSQSTKLIRSEQEQPTLGEDDNELLFVELGPLPMEPPSLELSEDNHVTSSWKVSPIRIIDVDEQCQIRLSCIFIHSGILDWIEDGSIEQEIFFKLALQGRLIKKDSVILIWMRCGFTIFQVSNVTVGASEDSDSDVAYRVNSCDLMSLRIDPPVSVQAEPRSTSTTTTSYQSIPGYEEQLEEILATLHIHNTAAAPSAILLTGPTGVGKSRMGACIAYHYEQQGNAVCLLSIQELIFRALTETDLLQDYISPILEGCSLCVLDDLHLLELGESDETQRDMEYTIVQNAITHLIDQYKDRCKIVGISQAQSKLPTELTRIARLEKSFNMLAPTQVQRETIWESLLTSDAVEAENTKKWSLVLASATSGCVAEDLVNVYQDARTRSWEISQNSGSTKLTWNSLRDAAHACIPSQLSDLDVVKPKLEKMEDSNCWSDFAAYTSVKKIIFRSVIIPWRRFFRYMDLPLSSQESWLEPPPGVLFHGPSGCGKTKAVGCLAGSLGLPMIQVRAADILDKWLGGSEALLRSLFARARAASPCILFLDEIDSIANNREEDDSNDLSSRILSTLLNEMDGVSSSIKTSRVLVIACTNRFKSLDSALLRPGRLQEHFYLGLPTVEELVEILQLRMTNIPLADNIDLVKIATDLFARNATGADVEGLCREVCLMAFRRSDNPDEVLVTTHEIDRAVQAVMKSQVDTQ
jgi:SpoVK/Ycf46/Vps4 family AAA+-type ATPase